MATATVRNTNTDDTFDENDEILIVESSTTAAIAVPNLARVELREKAPGQLSLISRVAIVKNLGTAPVVISDPGDSTINGATTLTLSPGQEATIVSRGHGSYVAGINGPIN